MSLKQFEQKIKSFWGGGEGLVLGLIFMLSATFSFGLSEASSILEANSKLFWQENYTDPVFTMLDPDHKEGESNQVAASINGTKYYFLHCSGLNRIKAENLVYFSSEEAAKRAGYDLASNCQK